MSVICKVLGEETLTYTGEASGDRCLEIVVESLVSLVESLVSLVDVGC